MNANTLFVMSDSNRHLGLFSDLVGVGSIDLLVFPNHRSIARKVLTRLSPSATLSLCFSEAEYSDHYDQVVILDTALARLSNRAFERLALRADAVSVVLLNSLSASSPSFQPAKERLHYVNPDSVYTFDPVDAKKYGYKDLGLFYYSRPALPEVTGEPSDCYFIGGVKGNRGELIRSSYSRMIQSGVAADFECMLMKGERSESADTPGIHWHTATWKSYSEVLSRVASTKCVVEILQEGQHAQSIRYFEAVCFDKKLLTNNPAIFDLPYYDERYMKFFETPEQIDCDWLKDSDAPSYHYAGDFSPLNLPMLQ